MKTHDVANIILINKRGQFLLQLRDDKLGIRNPGMLTMWGGAVEGDETIMEAALRELYEETGLTPTAEQLQYFGTYPRDDYVDGKQIVNHVYLLPAIDEATLDIREGEGYVAVQPDPTIDDPLFTDLTKEFITDYASNL